MGRKFFKLALSRLELFNDLLKIYVLKNLNIFDLRLHCLDLLGLGTLELHQPQPLTLNCLQLMLELTYYLLIGCIILLRGIELLSENVLALFCFGELVPETAVGGEGLPLAGKLTFMALPLETVLKPGESFELPNETIELVYFLHRFN